MEKWNTGMRNYRLEISLQINIYIFDNNISAFLEQ